MPITLLATFTVHADCTEAFEGVIARLAPQVRATEPGVTFYQLARSRTDPLVYRMWEVYVDQAALDAHGQTPHLLAEMDALMACQARPPAIEVLDVVAAPW